MRRWFFADLLLLLLGMILAPATPLSALEYPDTLVEKPLAKLSDQELSDWGRLALGINAPKWQHGETKHFVIHFFRSGQKIATRSEAFYAEIREFFGNRPDLLGERKSQIFAFSEQPDWHQFLQGIQQTNLGGITRGNEFFYLATTDGTHFDSKGKVQAHEMTHLVFNRFFSSTPPLWLNEGVAEYFGERKTSTITEFRRQMSHAAPDDLEALFAATAYPDTATAVRSFYAEAAIFVDFLTHTQERRALLPRFVEAMIADNDVEKAAAIYGYKNLQELKTAYDHYRKRFAER